MRTGMRHSLALLAFTVGLLSQLVRFLVCHTSKQSASNKCTEQECDVALTQASQRLPLRIKQGQHPTQTHPAVAPRYTKLREVEQCLRVKPGNVVGGPGDHRREQVDLRRGLCVQAQPFPEELAAGALATANHVFAKHGGAHEEKLLGRLGVERPLEGSTGGHDLHQQKQV